MFPYNQVKYRRNKIINFVLKYFNFGALPQAPSSPEAGKQHFFLLPKTKTDELNIH